MRRFFIPPDRIENATARLDADQSRHLSKVLRLKTGDDIVVSDGKFEYMAKVAATEGKEVAATILSRIESKPEPAFDLFLAIALIKGPRMDTAIEKAVELGVAGIIPVATRRSVPKIEEASGRLERWRKIAGSAAAQCGRKDVPKIDCVTSLRETIRAKADLKVLLYEGNRECGTGALIEKWKSISKSDCRPKAILMVGPEGGFTKDEVESATEIGWTTWGLGSLVLRAETASIVGASILIHTITGKLF